MGRSRTGVLSLSRTGRASTLGVSALQRGDCLCAPGILLAHVICLRAVGSARNVCSWLCQDRTLSVQQLQAGAYRLLIAWAVPHSLYSPGAASRWRARLRALAIFLAVRSFESLLSTWVLLPQADITAAEFHLHRKRVFRK